MEELLKKSRLQSVDDEEKTLKFTAFERVMS